MKDMTTWVAFGISPEILPDVEDPHITLAFCGSNYLPDEAVELSNIVSRCTKFYGGPFEVITEYPELWNDKDVVVPVMIPGKIKMMRESLVLSMFMNNLWFSTKYDWRPHITIGDNKGEYKIPPTITVSSVFIQHGGNRIEWVFNG